MSSTNRSRYFEVAEELRAQVRRGVLAPGDRLPSFPQMKAQGISQHTMEKAYALLEHDGLIERTNGSGVYVAQGNSHKKAAMGLIGFFGFPSTQPQQFGMHFYGAHLQEGARETAKKHGLHIMLLDGDADASAWRKLDGVLSTDVQISHDVPHVHLLVAGVHYPSILPDEETGIRAAIRHLMELGHRRIAYLLAVHEPYHTRRLTAYQAGMSDSGITVDPRWVRHLCPVMLIADGFVAAAHQRMAQWLREDWKQLNCTALLCQNDQTAIGVIEALHEAGVRVPDDVSVIGFDGTEAATYSRPRLTTVHVPLYEIGAKSVDVLVEQMNGEQDANIHMLPTRLKIGASTAPVGNHKSNSGRRKR